MQGRWTIGKKLFTGVGVLIALLMASGATTLWTTRAMNERLVHTGEKTVRRIRLAERAQAEPLRMYIAEQMMLLARAAGDKALHDTWKAKFDAAQAALQTELTAARRPAGAGLGKEALGQVQAGLGGLPARPTTRSWRWSPRTSTSRPTRCRSTRCGRRWKPTRRSSGSSSTTRPSCSTRTSRSPPSPTTAPTWTGLALLGIGLSVAGLVGWVGALRQRPAAHARPPS